MDVWVNGRGVQNSDRRVHSAAISNVDNKLDSIQQSAYRRHGTSKSAQYRYRRTAGTAVEIFPHCAVTDFPNFTLHISRLMDYP